MKKDNNNQPRMSLQKMASGCISVEQYPCQKQKMNLDILIRML